MARRVLGIGLGVLTLLGLAPVRGAGAHAQFGNMGKVTPDTGGVGLPCTDRPPHMPGLSEQLAALQCFQTRNGYGWVFALNSRDAVGALRLLEERAPKFEKYFGRRIGRGIWLASGPIAFDTILNRITKAAGVKWIYAGTEPDAIDAHEVAHGWFFAAVAPSLVEDKTYKGPYQYGSRLPDWLDEAAALSMEGQGLINQRRKDVDLLSFSSSTLASAEQSTRQTRANTAPSWEQYMAAEVAQMKKMHTFGGGKPLAQGPAAQLLPLDSIFRMRHPMDNSSLATVAWRQIYGQVSGVLEFLSETTGDLSVLGSITTGLLSDSTLAQWLQAHGAEYNLPGTMQGLEKKWQAWIRQRQQKRKQAYEDRAAQAAKP